MRDCLKRVAKKTPLYGIYKSYQLKKNYCEKHNIDFTKANRFYVMRADKQKRILRKAKINNIAFGDFFFSLDTSIIFDKRKQVIDNIPIDYGYVINKCSEDVPSYVRKYLKRINDSRINFGTPTSLKEALQLILFWNGLLWQTGHTLVGLGRLDKVLAPYQIPEDAEKLICEFLLTLHTDYIYKSAALKGDTGQIIILGGINEDSTYFCNEYTYLFIKCLKKVCLPDPKVLLRCSKIMPYDLINLAIECVSTGIGSPLFSNDDVVVPKLCDFGYETKDAYNYGVSACWEPLSIGNSLEQNNLANIRYGKCTFDMFTSPNFSRCKSFDEVLTIFSDNLKYECFTIIHDINKIKWMKDPLLSSMMGIEGDLSTGCAKYNNYGVLSVGISSAVDSLLNIHEYVFRKHIYSLEDIQKKVLLDDVNEFKDNVNGFGTDNNEAVNLTNYIIKKTEEFFRCYRNKFGGKVKFGLSSPSYISTAFDIGATLDGRKAGEPFRTHISRDKGESITEILNFESKLIFSGMSCNGNVVDVIIEPSLMRNNIDKFADFVMGGIKEGIFQLQMNVFSYADLIDAKEHPEKYPNLIVRVWGFSAYFNDLPEEYKDNLIRRAKEMEKIA